MNASYADDNMQAKYQMQQREATAKRVAAMCSESEADVHDEED